MTTECIADAHAILWFLEGNLKLGPAAQQMMSDPQIRITIPAIALAEACRVAEKHRSTVGSARDLLAMIDADTRLGVEAVDRDLVARCIDLTIIPEMHDRLIVATAIRRREANPTAVLLSDDADIRDASVVPILW